MTKVFPLPPSLPVKADVSITISELEGPAGERTSCSVFPHSGAGIWMLHCTLNPLELEKPPKAYGVQLSLAAFPPYD